MNHWSGIDFFIFFIFFLNTILGISRAATKEIISMMCLSVALIFLIKFTIPLTMAINSSPFIQNVVTSTAVQGFMESIGAGQLTTVMVEQLNYVLSILICFVGAFCAGEAVLAFTSIAEVYSFPYAALNRKVGGALGAIRGYVIAVILILVLQHLYLGNLNNNSYFISFLKPSADQLDSFIRDQNPENYKEILKGASQYNIDQGVVNTLDWQKQ